MKCVASTGGCPYDAEFHLLDDPVCRLHAQYMRSTNRLGYRLLQRLEAPQ